MTVRNWYQAICEDLDIDLIELRKAHEAGIDERSLRSYRNKGNVPRNQAAKNAILALIQERHPHFTKEELEAYFGGEHAEDLKAQTRQQCIRNLCKALKSVNDAGLRIDEWRPGLPSEIEELAEWIYRSINLPGGLETVGGYLEYVREQTESLTQLYTVKGLHDAIAPLVIADDRCIEPALEHLVKLEEDVSKPSRPAVAGLAISRARGRTQRLGMEFDERGFRQFASPDNAVVESCFSAEQDNIKQRLAHRLFAHLKLIAPDKEPGDIEFEEEDYKRLERHGAHSSQLFSPPFIYLKNANNDYPIDQLEDYSAFSGFHRFADQAQHDITVFSDAFSIDWLLKMYAELETMEKGLSDSEKIKTLIEKLPRDKCNAEIVALQQDLENLSSKDLITRANEITTLMVRSGQIVGKAPEIAEAGESIFTYSSKLYDFLLGSPIFGGA